MWLIPIVGCRTACRIARQALRTSDPSDPYQLDANGIAKDPVTEETLGFFADAVSREEPFFCYYSTWLVHTPIQMRTESLLQKYAGLMGYSYPFERDLSSLPRAKTTLLRGDG